MIRKGFADEATGSEEKESAETTEKRKTNKEESPSLLQKIKPLRYWSVIALVTFLLGYLVVEVLTAHQLLPDFTQIWDQMIS